MKIVILYSSGLDSFLMKEYADRMYPLAEKKYLYYKHGADSEDSEIAMLPDFVEVRNIDWLGDTCKPVTKKDDPFAGAIYIPGRNLVFSVLAACQELPDEVWLGVLADECNPEATDKNNEFKWRTQDAISYALSPFRGYNPENEVEIRFPFVEEKWTKENAVNWALLQGIDPKEITKTISCWHHDGLPCGECKQCFKRYFIFLLNKLQETYRVHPLYSRHGKELLKLYLTCEPKNKDEKTVVDMIKRATPFLDVPIQNTIRDILLEASRKDSGTTKK